MAEFLDDQTKRIMKNLSGLDNTTELTLKDLPYIRMAMVDVASHWYNIGIHFGIPTGKMDEIRSKNRNDPDFCLTSILVVWLRTHNLKLGPPTWRKVVIAVSSRVGGDHPSLASKIAKEYKRYKTAKVYKDSDKVDNRVLTPESGQVDVMDAILDGVATNWIAIGLFLGIPYNRIEMFQVEGDLEGRINKMVAFWLGRKHNTEEFGEPSWRKLVDAVAARSGGCHQRLAAEIAMKHPLVAEVETQPSPPTSPAAPVNPPVNPEILTEKDLGTLIRLLRPVAIKWEAFCVQLGVPFTEVQLIRQSPILFSGAPVSFFQEALQLWLSQRKGCTISTLCAALRSDPVDANELAGQVEKELRNYKGLATL